MNKPTGDFSEWENSLYNSGNSSKIGKLHGQRFYAARLRAGEELTIPFSRRKFSALLNLAGKFSDDEIRAVGLQLLQHGMACAVCIGEEAERVSQIIDELIDQNSFLFDGFTPYTQSEDGSLGEALEFFVLPTGLTETSLILTLNGDAGDNSRNHHTVIDALNEMFVWEAFVEDEDSAEELEVAAIARVAQRKKILKRLLTVEC